MKYSKLSSNIIKYLIQNYKLFKISEDKNSFTYKDNLYEIRCHKTDDYYKFSVMYSAISGDPTNRICLTTQMKVFYLNGRDIKALLNIDPRSKKEIMNTIINNTYYSLYKAMAAAKIKPSHCFDIRFTTNDTDPYSICDVIYFCSDGILKITGLTNDTKKKGYVVYNKPTTITDITDTASW